MKKLTLFAIMILIATSFNRAYSAENSIDRVNDSHLKIEQVKPGYNGITLQFSCPEDQMVSLNLIDAQGHVIMTKEIAANKGSNTELIDIDVQAVNFLVIMLNNNTEQLTKRIIANNEYAIVN
jgi:hypothetical protein